MTSESELRATLRSVGLTTSAIDAVWPEWWSEDASGSPSATTELRFTVARRLGISPASLFDDRPTFLWHDETRFKNLGAVNDHEAAVLASFSVSVGRCAIGATPLIGGTPPRIAALDLRADLLELGPTVGLQALLVGCWSLRIPVIHLRIFPLQQKRMHAVAARLDSRYAILVGRESRFPSQVAFYIAHELGHIMSGHVANSAALLDVDDPLQAEPHPDEEEAAADRFALELLTGSESPEIDTDRASFTVIELAAAAMKEGASRAIDPGVIALCLAHRTGQWQEAIGALKRIPPGEEDVTRRINDLAAGQFAWDALTVDNQAFLRTIMGQPS